MNSTVDYFRLRLWVQWRSLLSTVRRLRGRSLLLAGVLAAFILGYLFLGYFLFYQGLKYLQNFPIIGVLIDQRILFLILAFFFIMLVFSNLIVGFTTLFRNRESAWMLTLPVPPSTIYQWKFFESLVVSSWAFLFLSAPMMAAYGRVHGADLLFYPLVLAAYIPFLLLPAAIGSWLVLVFVRLVARLVIRPSHLIVLGLLVLAGLMLVTPTSEEEAAAGREVLSFNQLLQHTRFTLNPFLPSYWMGTGIQAWVNGYWWNGLVYVLVLTANAAMALMLTFTVAGRFYYGGWNSAYARKAVQKMAETRQRQIRRTSWLEGLVAWLPFPSKPAKAMLVKDLRLFWRDPTQWSQFMIFFGLLAIYVLNLRNISYDYQSEFWSTLISFLNLGASSLTLSTLTTRFVYPQFSLEGKRLWILGLAPMGLERILMHKFWTSFLASSLVTLTLIVASSLILQLELSRLLIFCVAILLMSLGLSGLAVGLGAIFPNFREDNPSKIVSGFGGTLCLITSFLYVTAFIALMAYPYAAGFSQATSFLPVPPELIAFFLAILLSLAALFIPMGLARQRVKNLEM